MAHARQARGGLPPRSSWRMVQSLRNRARNGKRADCSCPLRATDMEESRAGHHIDQPSYLSSRAESRGLRPLGLPVPEVRLVEARLPQADEESCSALPARAGEGRRRVSLSPRSISIWRSHGADSAERESGSCRAMSCRARRTLSRSSPVRRRSTTKVTRFAGSSGRISAANALPRTRHSTPGPRVLAPTRSVAPPGRFLTQCPPHG